MPNFGGNFWVTFVVSIGNRSYGRGPNVKKPTPYHPYTNKAGGGKLEGRLASSTQFPLSNFHCTFT